MSPTHKWGMSTKTKPIIQTFAERQKSSHDPHIMETNTPIISTPPDPSIASPQELPNKNQWLSELAKAANDFLKNPDFFSSIQEAFQQVCTLLNASSIELMENGIRQDGTLCFSIISSWNASEVKREGSIQDIPYANFGIEFSDLINGVIYSSTLSNAKTEAHKNLMQSAQSKSILICPIFVHQQFWGTVLLDDINEERIWTRDEKEIMAAFASMIGAAIDRKQITESLLETEQRFANFSDATPIMIWMTDATDKLIYINKTWIDFTGKSIEFLQGKEPYVLIYPEDREKVFQYYQQRIQHREEISVEYRLLTVNGTYKWVVEHAKPRFLSDNSFVGYIGNLMDIDALKKSQEKDFYQFNIIQKLYDAVITTDLENRIQFWNSGAERTFGKKETAVLGSLLKDELSLHFVNTNDEEVRQELLQNGSWSGEMRYVSPSQQIHYLQTSLSTIPDSEGRITGYVGVYKDTTEKKKSLEALNMSEERYRSVIDALHEGIVLQNKACRIVSINQAALQILGLSWEEVRNVSSEEFQLKTIYEDGSIFEGKDHPAMHTLSSGKPCRDIIMGICRKDNSLVWISANTSPIFYSENSHTPDAVVISFNDITEKKKALSAIALQEQKIKSYVDHVQNFLDSITDAFFAINSSGDVFLWNTVLAKNTGISAQDAIGQSIQTLLPQLPAKIHEKISQSLQAQHSFSEEYYQASEESWMEMTSFPSNEGVFIYIRNITERKRQEMLINLEKRILEMNTATHALLKTTVDHFLTGLEEMFPGYMCAVNLHHEETATMESLSAPSLPASYKEMVSGMHVGPTMGTCGAAIYYKRPVIVSDISQSDLWVHCMGIAEQFNFKSSWAYPIFNANHHVLGTFSIFLQKVSSPKPNDEKIIERAVQLLKRVIEFKLFEEKIKASNERYLLATMATNDAIWDVDMDAKVIYWAEGFHTLFGYQAGSFKESERTWENAVHPQDLEKVETSIQSFIASKSHKIWQEEYRFKRADGRFVLVVDRGFLIFDQMGRVTRMVGSMQDITEKRELENRLIKQEVNRHKFVSQAVVDAQEKERSEIGKELHDNVNQILSTAKLYLEVARNHEEEREKLLGLSAQYISVAINEIRSISKSLVPTSIGDIGLIESIQDLMESVKLTKAIKIHFNYDKTVDQILTEQQKLMLYRIIQEQLNNVLKHAKAENFTIEMMYEDSKLQVIMTDDGIGFDPELIKHKKGVGLFNINSRVELFHGKADIFSSPGAGCSIMIQIPISQI